MGRTAWITIGEWALVALLGAYLGGRTLPHAWHTLNTDFPNYYLTAHLAHEGDDIGRIYERIWIQRQKNHLAIDQPLVGMVPITPLSTLAVRPLSSFSPLAAKRCWLVFNFGLLIIVAGLLQSMTQLPWRRIVLVVLLSFPLQINFLFGQYYVLLLFVLTLACWLYLRQQRFWAGLMVGLGFGLKVFPILYLLYFLRKKDIKALLGGITGCLAAAIASIACFGWPLNRTYITQVLPWALRGDAMDPYNLASSSIATLLHRLFVYEPQWNPHPAFGAPWMFALLHPLLQLMVLAPALLLAIPKRIDARQLRLEWAAMLAAILSISTLPASYDFTLLILPVCLFVEALLSQRRYRFTATVLLLYLAVGFPKWKTTAGSGWLALTGVPRLYALVLLCLVFYTILLRQRKTGRFARDEWVWSCGLTSILLFSVASGLLHQRGLYADYRWRLPAPEALLMAAHPVMQGDHLLFIAMTRDGYSTGEQVHGVTRIHPTEVDRLAQAATANERWFEESQRESRIISTDPRRAEINQAEFPVASFDGKWLAFLREKRGRARLWVHTLHHPGPEDRLLTPESLNVFEMSFLADDSIVFAATDEGSKPQLFTVDMDGNVKRLAKEEARYPAASPDGNWLAYSRLHKGNWNLWIRNMRTGEARRITDAECNDVDSAWDADSKTLIYASDCGRALGLTALCRRRVLP